MILKDKGIGRVTHQADRKTVKLENKKIKVLYNWKIGIFDYRKIGRFGDRDWDIER